ncbi:MAG: D-aminoacylase [Clostridiaceae bacterium]|nr:D-aminoacylase [Clostridiaceae bacterium]
MLDCIIKNGNIVDGTGKPSFISDIGIQEGKIAKVGSLQDADAARVIDAKGYIVTPGFIDGHSHSDLIVGIDSEATNILGQGITTEVTGNCGWSLAPYSEENFNMFGLMFPSSMRDKLMQLKSMSNTFGTWMEGLGSLKMGTNMACYVGHSALRLAAMGTANRIPTDEEMDKMKELLRESLEAGAFGFTTGLIYPPGAYAREEEITELCKVVAEYDRIYTTHMRNESHSIIPAIEETLRIVQKSGVRSIISHHKVMSISQAGLSERTLEMLDNANLMGLRVATDQYPYRAGATRLTSALPPRHASEGVAKLIEKLKDEQFRAQITEELKDENTGFENLIANSGGFDGVLVGFARNTPQYNGRFISDIAVERNMDAFETFYDIIIENEGNAMGAFFITNEDDIERIFKHPRNMIGTDAAHATFFNLFGHPRSSGTFARVMSHYVRDRKLVTLEEGIRKATSLPAETIGIANKGIINEGYDADILVIDYENLADKADYVNPNAKNVGYKYVLVNGQIALAEDACTGILAGKALRKK